MRGVPTDLPNQYALEFDSGEGSSLFKLNIMVEAIGDRRTEPIQAPQSEKQLTVESLLFCFPCSSIERHGVSREKDQATIVLKSPTSFVSSQAR